MLEKRRVIAQRYHTAFASLPAIQLPADGSAHQHAWHLYMMRLNLERLRIDRSAFIEELKRRNIGVSVHFIPLHIHPYYRETFGYEVSDYPVAYSEYLREISLPIYSKMSDRDVGDVIDAVAEIIAAHAR